MTMNEEELLRMERSESLDWAEGLCLVVMGEKLMLGQKFFFPPPFLCSIFLSFCVTSWFFWPFCKCQPS